MAEREVRYKMGAAQSVSRGNLRAARTAHLPAGSGGRKSPVLYLARKRAAIPVGAVPPAGRETTGRVRRRQGERSRRASLGWAIPWSRIFAPARCNWSTTGKRIALSSTPTRGDEDDPDAGAQDLRQFLDDDGPVVRVGRPGPADLRRRSTTLLPVRRAHRSRRPPLCPRQRPRRIRNRLTGQLAAFSRGHRRAIRP